MYSDQWGFPESDFQYFRGQLGSAIFVFKSFWKKVIKQKQTKVKPINILTWHSPGAWLVKHFSVDYTLYEKEASALCLSVESVVASLGNFVESSSRHGLYVLYSCLKFPHLYHSSVTIRSFEFASMSFDKFAKKSLWSKESKVRTDSSNTNTMYLRHVVVLRELAVYFVTYQKRWDS